MPTPEQKKKLLKAKIAVALHDEFCRVPKTEEIDYARVSKNEQNLDPQGDALIKASCREQNIFTDKITGTKAERKGLEQALIHLREGDTLVVWRLDRLGRS